MSRPEVAEPFLRPVSARIITRLLDGESITTEQAELLAQVPVADAAVTISGFSSYTGEAMAIGERTPLALLDASAAARMSVGEAITNIASASVPALSAVRLSANWMAPAGHPREGPKLYDAARSIGLDPPARLPI